MFVGRYTERWEQDLKKLGLYGPNFDYFWRPIEEFILGSDRPVGQLLLDGSGARGFLTEDGAPDIPRLVVYLKADEDGGRVVFLGCDLAALPDDYPPADWR